MTMQERKIKTVDEFLSVIQEEELQIVDILREMILNGIPKCREKISYNVPFYSGYKTICYLWPGSILWGKKQSYEGVRLGFTNGYLMSDEHKILEKGDRKQVYWITIRAVKEINPHILQQYIQEAVIIDEQNQFC